jgi:hypothetical protein
MLTPPFNYFIAVGPPAPITGGKLAKTFDVLVYFSIAHN